MAVLKLEILKNETILECFDPPRYVWVNTDRLEYWYANGDHSTIHTSNHGRFHVAIAPDDLAVAIDPENACPAPDRCGYPEYLSYRKEGQTDLAHGTFHTAERIASTHMTGCRMYERGRECSLCRSFEERLRA